MDAPFRDLFRQLILSGFDDFEKHSEVALTIRKADTGVGP